MKIQSAVSDNVDINGGVISEEKGNNSKPKRKFVYVSVVCAILLLAAVWLGMGIIQRNRAYDRTYSFELNTSADTTKEFNKNCKKSYQMTDNLLKNLPYSGKYPAGKATGKYTVDTIPADGYPDYFAGKYINVDGKLIILIKENYFEKKYRKCDWYKELAGLLGSEDFGCRPVKYNYTELINGMSDYVWGLLGQEIKSHGIELSGAGLDDYGNRICIRVKTEEDAQIVQRMFPNDMYKTVVVGEQDIWW